jgi:hypothetical protein
MMGSNVSVRYICIKTFKYGDKVYTPGMVFVPRKGKFDDQILANGNLVRRDLSAYMNRTRGRGAKKHGKPENRDGGVAERGLPDDEPGELDGGKD